MITMRSMGHEAPGQRPATPRPSRRCSGDGRRPYRDVYNPSCGYLTLYYSCSPDASIILSHPHLHDPHTLTHVCPTLVTSLAVLTYLTLHLQCTAAAARWEGGRASVTVRDVQSTLPQLDPT